MEIESIAPLAANVVAWLVISFFAGWAAWHRMWFLMSAYLVMAAASGTYVTAAVISWDKPPPYISWPVSAVQLTVAIVAIGRTRAQRRSRSSTSPAGTPAPNETPATP